MIKNWLVTGDTHGQVLERLSHNGYPPDETALIILGDMGLNFYLNKTDQKNKRNVNATGFRIYAVRSNHEERPENLFMEQMYDEDIDGGWFKDEQLTKKEMDEIGAWVEGKRYDFVLTHTCPISWEPRDLFLSGLDQSKVDKSMELWLEDIKSKVDWEVWLCGHYHDDRLIRPGAEMYFHDIESLDTIWERWQDPESLDWWVKKDPNYYMGR